MRRLRSLGCGCLLSCLTLPLLLMVLAVGGAGASAGPALGVTLGAPNGTTPVRMAWTPLYSWTPPTGEPNQSEWPWGQCTWLVVSEGRSGGDHRISWSGDAWQWIANARAAGVGTEPPDVTPSVGWIVVYQRGHGASPTAGHVATVVAVSATNYTVVEANVLGLGIVDERVLPLPGRPAGSHVPLVEGWIP